MTIAAGFICHEGVLLASDTLYAGINKRYGRKLWTVKAGNNLVCFGGAGLQGGLERTQDEIAQRLLPGMDRATVIAMLEDVLQHVLDVQQPADGEQTSGLFAIRIGTACQLFENTDGKTMLSPIGHAGQCVGWATALGQYFLDQLYQQPMPMKWARIVAAHLIRQAKQYSEYCGGDTHVLEIRADGSERMVTDQVEIQRDEQYLGQLDEAMRLVLPTGRVQDEMTLDFRLETVVDAIKKAAGLFVVPVGDGLAAIVSGLTDATDFKPQTTFRKVEGEDVQAYPSPKRDRKRQPPSQE